MTVSDEYSPAPPYTRVLGLFAERNTVASFLCNLLGSHCTIRRHLIYCIECAHCLKKIRHFISLDSIHSINSNGGQGNKDQ